MKYFLYRENKMEVTFLSTNHLLDHYARCFTQVITYKSYLKQIIDISFLHIKNKLTEINWGYKDSTRVLSYRSSVQREIRQTAKPMFFLPCLTSGCIKTVTCKTQYAYAKGHVKIFQRSCGCTENFETVSFRSFNFGGFPLLFSLNLMLHLCSLIPMSQ